MSNPSEILDAQINAGWKHAAAYDGDDRQDIKSDVFNAFQAGVVWERRRALEGRPSLEMARIQRLKDAIEGECEGLAITDEHAKAILEYVDETERSETAARRPAGEDRADAVRYRWLRAQKYIDIGMAWFVPMHDAEELTPEAMDAAIDAAIATETQRSSSGARSDETSKPSQPEGS